LGLVVREYVLTATPVSSKCLAEQYDLGVSSATIRNELASLEEGGYLTHPHTSSGRVPTEKGYRYFVEHLLGRRELPLAEQRRIRHQFHQIYPDLEQWARLAATVLAQAARNAALVTTPKAACCRLKHLGLFPIHELLILLTMVLQEGIIKQRMLSLSYPASQEELERTASRLNELLVGLSAEEIEARIPHLSSLEAQVASVVADTMAQLDESQSGELYQDGLANLLSQPEFADVRNARRLVQLLEEETLLKDVLSHVLAMNGVQVIIGGEGKWEELSDYSLVLSRYGVEDRAMGALGVLGPLRMPYGRVISAVRYVAELLSELVNQLCGQPA